MKPRVCYRSTQLGVNRYTLMYEKLDNYQGWKWTSFDTDLFEKLCQDIKGLKLVAHIEQPSQPNGMSFKKNMQSIFGNQLLTKKLGVMQNKHRFLKWLDSLFAADMYSGILDAANKHHFFSRTDLGCFWYLFMLSDKDTPESLPLCLNDDTINNDNFFATSQRFPCILYRDYLRNSLSVLSMEVGISDTIDCYVREKKIPIIQSEISNIFDTRYIDELPGNVIKRRPDS